MCEWVCCELWGVFVHVIGYKYCKKKKKFFVKKFFSSLSRAVFVLMFIQKSYLSPTFFKLNVLFALKCAIVADFCRAAGSSSTNRLFFWVLAIHRMAATNTRAAKPITAFRFDLRSIFVSLSFTFGRWFVPQQPASFEFYDFISNTSQIDTTHSLAYCLVTPQKSAKEQFYAAKWLFFLVRKESHTHRLRTHFFLFTVAILLDWIDFKI